MDQRIAKANNGTRIAERNTKWALMKSAPKLIASAPNAKLKKKKMLNVHA